MSLQIGEWEIYQLPEPRKKVGIQKFIIYIQTMNCGTNNIQASSFARIPR